jgi:RNA polymerase sigma factor (sigma-70 family)
VNSLTDQQLLRDFLDHRSDAAFAELVRRHVDLVYSAALRIVGDSHHARDVTQGAFVALAQNAGKLTSHPVLSGWLHRTAQNLAANIVRANVRRQAREQEAVTMNQLLAAETEPGWEQIAPHLDAALGELNDADRDAVMLRYFEKKTAGEIATQLGINEETAQKRVSRAVEKLREFFAKRKITIGVGSMGILISANAVQSAPIGLAATISAAALVGTAATTSTVIAATTKTIAMTTLQKTLVTATVAVLTGAGIYEAKQAHDARNAVAKLQAEQAPLALEITRLQAEANKLSELLANAKDQKQLTQVQFNELLKLRGQMGVKQANAEVVNDPAFQQAQIWLAKEKKIREQFELHPEQKIPEMQFLKEEDWLDHARHADVDTAKGMRIALCNIRASASGIFAEKFTLALQAYMEANQQQLPATASQVAGYFKPPLQDTDVIFSRYVVPAASDSFFAMNPSMMTNMLFVQDKSTVVDPIDQRVAFGQRETVWLPPLQPSQMHSVLPPELDAVAKAFSDANGQGFLSAYDLKPYATTPEQKAALDKFILSLNPNR